MSPQRSFYLAFSFLFRLARQVIASLLFFSRTNPIFIHWIGATSAIWRRGTQVRDWWIGSRLSVAVEQTSHKRKKKQKENNNKYLDPRNHFLCTHSIMWRRNVLIKIVCLSVFILGLNRKRREKEPRVCFSTDRH